MSTKSVIKIEHEDRKDPTLFLPEEDMCYEIKKKKKKKKRKQEDPFKDLEEKSIVVETALTDADTTGFLDPEVSIKVENIEVELDFNDFANHTGLMLEGPQSEDSQEPEVKIQQSQQEAVLLTFESIINDKTVIGYNDPSQSTPAKVYTCKVCHLIFKSLKTLKMHQRRKHKSFRKTFKHICDFCGMSYEQKNSLNVHIRRKHGPEASEDDMKERICEICSLVFKGTARLRMHMRRKHGAFEEAFKHVCEDCGLTYDKYRSLMVHIKRKHSGITNPVGNEWYNCPFCPKIFSRRETYVRHIQRKHKIDEEDNNDEDAVEHKRNEVGEIMCKECPLVFSSVNYLKLHMRRKHNAYHDKFRLKCRICNLSYDKIESLKRHVRRKHDNQSHCDVCNKQFESNEQYLNHSHVKPILECSICGLIFASQGGLAKHLRCTHKIDTPKTVFCSICNEGFNDKRHLKPHYLKVHLKVSYTCNFCSKVFKAKGSYRRHILFKHPKGFEAQNQQCDSCNESFPDEFELCRHVNMAHRKTSGEHDSGGLVPKTEDAVQIKKEKEYFQCTKCSGTFISWEELRLHYEQNHQVVNETQCQICGQLIAENELQKHIKSAHKEMLQCKFCDFKTTERVSMTQHMLRHKNAKTLNCGHAGCKYKTFYETAMERHVLRHKSEVKLQCSQCPFQSMNKYLLRYHEEAHATGKKRYTCNECNYATTLPANLVQHRYKHSKVKRFKCEVCPFETKYNTSLRFHVKKKHCDLPSLC